MASKVKSNKVYCGHCQLFVERSTFYRHKKRFYDTKTQQWISSKDAKTKYCRHNAHADLGDLFDEPRRDKTSNTFVGNDLLDDSYLDIFTASEQDLNRKRCTPVVKIASGKHQTDVDIEMVDVNNFSSDEPPSNEEQTDQESSEEKSDNDQSEVWEDVLYEELESDLNSCNNQPCPEPTPNQNVTQKVTALVQWFVYFILIWQSVTKISDNGLEWLLQFSCQFFKVLSALCESEYLAKLVFIFPSSLFLMRKYLSFDRDNFQKFAVCSKCSKLYDLKDCTELDRYGKRTVKYCQHKKFPRSRACGTPLAKKVLLSDGVNEFYPLHIYCYNSIINKLEEMVKRKNFPCLCESWRNLKKEDGYISDITHGQVWKDFHTINGQEFLSQPRNYLYMLNFDFFQPKKHRSDYSVGVFYLANLNLPSNVRMKWENIIVVGIVPGLQKEPHSLNEFLNPMVKEMKALWKGVYLKSSLSFIPLHFRAAIGCVSCDIPAARKICGFKGHSSNYGCSKCNKYFPGNIKDGIDYSGFDRDLWPKRTIDVHRRNAKKLNKAQTKSEYDQLTVKFGMYYSSLLQLEYFDAIRFTVIDPMHNLFLGTAKSMFKLWVEEGIISKNGLHQIEKRIKSFEICSGHGRLPHKISANYGSYTASQWKNWTLVYSMYALHDIIPNEDLMCWQSFVLACKFLSKPVITSIDLDKADFLLMQFCKKYEKLYGTDKVKPNMHLHGHLKECILDYGPMQNFWCFSFERYNGILGSFSTNNRSVEVQMMRKLLSENVMTGLTLPEEFKDAFNPIVSRRNMNENQDTDYFEFSSKLSKCSLTQDPASINWKELESIVSTPTVYKIKVLDNDDLINLHRVYSFMYGEAVSTISVGNLPRNVRKFGTVKIGNERFGSQMECRSLRSARITASWTSENGTIDLGFQRPGKICYYIQHNLPLPEGYQTHIFAIVDWYEEHENNGNYMKPIEVFKPYFIAGGPSRFLPAPRISSKVALATTEVEGELVVVPLNRDFS